MSVLLADDTITYHLWLNRQGLLCVVAMTEATAYEWSDTSDRFLTEPHPGDEWRAEFHGPRRMTFQTEEAAKRHLNDHFKPEFIRPEDRILTERSIAHMRKEPTRD